MELPQSFNKIISAVRAKKSCSAFGVVNNLKPVIASMCGDNIVYVVSDYVSATKIKEYFDSLNLNASLFVPVADSFLYKKAQSNANNILRINTLFNIVTRSKNIVICTADSLFCPLPDPAEFVSHTIKFNQGDIVSLSKFVSMLAKSGYKQNEFASEKGQFCVRGEIIDIYPLNYDSAVRVDYFDDQIESISVLSSEGKPVKQLNNVQICPFTNLFLTDKQTDSIIQKLKKIKDRNVQPDEKAILDLQVDEIIAKLEAGDLGFNLDLLLSYLGEPFTVFDYFKDAPVFFIDESKLIYDNMTYADKENSSRIKSLQTSGMLLASPQNTVNSIEKIMEKLKNLTGVVFQKITNANRFFNPDVIVDFNSKPVQKYIKDTAGLCKDIDFWHQDGFNVFLLGGKSCNNLQASLKAEYFNFKILPVTGNLNSSAILLSSYIGGFILPQDKIVVVGYNDLFAKQNNTGKLSVSRSDVFTLPKVGDYVVHAVHGIGVCEGVTKLEGTLGTKDYVVVRYYGGDKLYVPTTQMNLLDRFSGADVPKKLSKIGGADFEKVKQKVKQSVKKLAVDLVNLYATREQVKGFAFSKDNPLQIQFEKAFAYRETVDQLSAIAEIKKDMQSTKVMDRLLCGDVGFGKTEVAMRASFKAVMDNKQVAFLAPTTILSEQHYNTLKKRMQDFGVNVEVLNRFKTPKQAKEILSRLKQHKIDILCSTHRMLSDDVEFADLGLIVLDEEQKFGVNDKEKLKTKHKNVDVLTLSATPIPRTLHMSLSGIRDISIISTPPSERLPVSTYVTEFSDTLLRDAITREKNRGGQTFILYNRVESIYDFAKHVRDVVPDINILVGHGQLPANLLEQVVYDFYSGKADVLICTTIMENGIDIENANTLIVCDADRFGLSQLYQLRGRVGRSNKMAYAYFTYKYSKTLTEEAYKRLDAISEFTEFGSGFKLAMRDLEIRGSGNVLGAEQHGFLQKVGYDMYAKLLSEAVAEARGQTVETHTEAQMKVDINAYIPDDYLTESEERMIAYKKISAISSLKDKEDVKSQLEKTAGPLPLPAKNLIDIAYIKNLAGNLNITEVYASKNSAYLVFKDKECITGSEKIGEGVYKFNKVCTLDLSGEAKIKFTTLGTSEANYSLVSEFIVYVNNLQNADKN